MEQIDANLDLLRQILENLRSPDRLDTHPWADSLTVRDSAARDPSRAAKSPGARLALTLGELFRQLMPSTPPQEGKRLDTRWGRFGILAANYFAPLLFGRMYPRTLRDAWRRIDQAILLFVYGKTADELTPEQARPYELIGDAAVFPANSTISDWHRDGMQDLADLFLSREKHLSLSSGKPSVVLGENDDHQSPPGREKGMRSGRSRSVRRWVTIAVLIIGLLVLTAAGTKIWHVYKLAQAVRSDVKTLDQFNLASLDTAQLEQAGPVLNRTHQDIEALRAATSPWLWLAGPLDWIPVYGGDISSAGDLLQVASALTGSASMTYQTALPIWQTVHGNQTDLNASQLTGMLLKAQPALLQAQATLQEATHARQRIPAERLSPTVRSWLVRADGYSGPLDQALSLALALPRLLGASNEGPKTYLLVIQNEDELRATGGFITAVGKVVVWNGELISWDVADSYSVDDLTKAYPTAPWQMQSFMNIPIVTFRDANWSPDYPTAVLWAEYLYAYTNSYSADGVIALDQHVLTSLLAVTGPVQVGEIGAAVTADNVQQIMRSQKVPPQAELQDPNWYRKHFLNPIAAAILGKVLSGNGVSWERLLSSTLDELNQRHILVQLDDPVLQGLLAERGWDGSVSRQSGDYLMVVDTNVGYNKTNAVVGSQLVYDVDLQNPSAPTSSLAVFQHNDAQGPANHCDQQPAGIDRSTLDYWYDINRCYYDYLRVYVPAGAQLTGATPHAVTRQEMIMLDQNVPARVDLLDEKLQGLQGFGTLLVVSMGGSLETDFQFGLPSEILQTDPVSHASIYELRVQKQAGTVSIPITIRVHLPAGSGPTAISSGGTVREGDNLLFDAKLTTDVTIRIQFRP